MQQKQAVQTPATCWHQREAAVLHHSYMSWCERCSRLWFTSLNTLSNAMYVCVCVLTFTCACLCVIWMHTPQLWLSAGRCGVLLESSVYAVDIPWSEVWLVHQRPNGTAPIDLRYEMKNS